MSDRQRAIETEELYDNVVAAKEEKIEALNDAIFNFETIKEELEEIEESLKGIYQYYVANNCRMQIEHVDFDIMHLKDEKEKLEYE